MSNLTLVLLSPFLLLGASVLTVLFLILFFGVPMLLAGVISEITETIFSIHWAVGVCFIAGCTALTGYVIYLELAAKGF